MVMGLFNLFRKNKEKRTEKQATKKSFVPLHMGMRDERFHPIMHRLETAFSPDFQNDLKERVIKIHGMSEIKFDFAMHELKRFFVLCALLKTVPMYSKDVDLLWHEMLMFTKDYDLFCQEFAGFKIHHTPNVARLSEPISAEGSYEKRVVFDLAYSTIYHINTYNHYLNGHIYQDVPNDILHIVDKNVTLQEKTPESQLLKDMMLNRIVI
jgi:hypothetical protein